MTTQISNRSFYFWLPSIDVIVKNGDIFPIVNEERNGKTVTLQYVNIPSILSSHICLPQKDHGTAYAKLYVMLLFLCRGDPLDKIYYNLNLLRQHKDNVCCAINAIRNAKIPNEHVNASLDRLYKLVSAEIAPVRVLTRWERMQCITESTEAAQYLLAEEVEQPPPPEKIDNNAQQPHPHWGW